MASKSKKEKSVAPAAASAPAAPTSSTPIPTAPGPVPQVRPESPLSPTRYSRLVEKVELQNLNDRLACYIDRVRYLETENARLSVEVQTSRDTTTRETSNIKQMYEHELVDARKLLDETARERARLEIDTKRLWEENDDLKQRLDKKTKEFVTAENSARMYESRYSDLANKMNAANAERKKALDDVKDLEKEVEKLRKIADELRHQLEEETLARVDLENALQSLREEASFKDQIHTQELSETRTRRQVDITEIDGRLAEEYEAKLQQSLQELRDQYEHQMRINRDEIELLFDNKMKNLQSAASRHNKSAAAAIEELRITRSHNEELKTKIGDLEALNASLSARIDDLTKLLERERALRAEDEAEMQRLREEMTQQLQEYQDLMDIKVSLDLELAAYDKLLKGEEQRLNITPTTAATIGQFSQSFRSGRATPGGGRRTPIRPGGKRKRTVFDESEDRTMSEFLVSGTAKGEIEIKESDPDGKFVKLHNKGDKEIAIGGWQLIRTAGANETHFKFHRSVKIEPNGTVTIWSSDTGATHEPPANIVMKQQKWFVADNISTQLMNSDGEEVATAQRVRHIVSSRLSRHRGDASLREELYHQQGDPQGNEKCLIM